MILKLQVLLFAVVKKSTQIMSKRLQGGLKCCTLSACSSSLWQAIGL